MTKIRHTEEGKQMFPTNTTEVEVPMGPINLIEFADNVIVLWSGDTMYQLLLNDRAFVDGFGMRKITHFPTAFAVRIIEDDSTEGV